jgi:hypothetical protein
MPCDKVAYLQAPIVDGAVRRCQIPRFIFRPAVSKMRAKQPDVKGQHDNKKAASVSAGLQSGEVIDHIDRVLALEDGMIVDRAATVERVCHPRYSPEHLGESEDA